MTDVPVRAYGGTQIATVPVTVTVRSIDIETTIATFAVTLPAGRWLTSVRVAQSTGANGQPLAWSSDDTLASPGTVTVPALGPQWTHLDVDTPANQRDVLVEVTVLRRVGSAWVAYATTAVRGAPVVLTGGTPAARRTGQKRVANIHPWSSDQSAAKQLGLITRAAGMGFTHVRSSLVPMIGWRNDSTFDPAWLAENDAWINAANTAGLKVIAGLALGSVPSWYAGASTTRTTGNVAFSGSYKNVRDAATSLTGLWTQADISAMVAALATRYGSTISHYQPQNEPDHAQASPNQAFPVMTAADVATTTKRVKTAVAASSQTGVKTYLGPLTKGDQGYFDAILAAGLLTSDYDLIGCHAYHVDFTLGAVWTPRRPMNGNYDQSLPGAERFRAHCVAAGHSAPFSIDEFGVSTTTQPGFAASEEQQADWVPYLLEQAARLPYADVVGVHSTEDVGLDRATWNNVFGMVRADNATPKPSVATVTARLAALPA